MAETIARAIGRGRTTSGDASRLGTVSAEGQANTRRTFTTAKVNADGSGEVQIERTIASRRVVIARLSFGPETELTTVNQVVIDGEGLVKGDRCGTWALAPHGAPVVTKEMLRPVRRCPCGDMTANDCAGECGRYVVYP